MLKAFDEIESSHKADLYPQQNLSFMLAQNFLSLSLSFNSHAFAQYISVQMVLFSGRFTSLIRTSLRITRRTWNTNPRQPDLPSRDSVGSFSYRGPGFFIGATVCLAHWWKIHTTLPTSWLWEVGHRIDDCHRYTRQTGKTWHKENLSKLISNSLCFFFQCSRFLDTHNIFQ